MLTVIFAETHEWEAGNEARIWLGWAQDVPTAYWRTYGVEQFDGIRCTLNGPLAPWTVKTAVLKYASQTFCSFTQGWAGFCTANKLKVGDTLIFTKLGFAEFEVGKA